MSLLLDALCRESTTKDLSLLNSVLLLCKGYTHVRTDFPIPSIIQVNEKAPKESRRPFHQSMKFETVRDSRYAWEIFLNTKK